MNKINNYMIILATIIVTGFFTILGLLVFVDMKPGNEKLLYITVGGLIANFGTVIGYYFGSSQGSKEKTDIIAAATPQPVAEVTTNNTDEL
jgi:hypothetical protein